MRRTDVLDMPTFDPKNPFVGQRVDLTRLAETREAWTAPLLHAGDPLFNWIISELIFASQFVLIQPRYGKATFLEGST